MKQKDIERYRRMISNNFSVRQAAEVDSIIRMAMVEQDRDTRHACAEAVIDCKIQDYSTNEPCRLKDEIYAAVMNCRGGVE